MTAPRPLDPLPAAPPPIAGGGPVTYVIQPAPTPLRWRDRPWLWLAAVVLVLGGVSFILAPWFAYRALSSAARYDDPAALAQLVDYDAVRASLKPQLVDPQAVRAQPPAPNPMTDPLAALRNAWAHRAWSPAVQAAPQPDGYLSPNGLMQVLAGKARTRQAPPLASKTLATPGPRLVYFDAHRVRFAVRDPADAKRETIVVLSRDKRWWTWRLAAIVLPDAGD